MRRALEEGRPPETATTIKPIVPSTTTVTVVPSTGPARPPEPSFVIELPYESRLSIRGRKTIAVTFKSTHASDAERARAPGGGATRSDFDMKQTLTVDVEGKVGRKTTVNVHFDDTREDKRDILVTYKGDKDEIVQEAAFGDVTLALPSSEFVGFSKQVFGAKADLKFKSPRPVSLPLPWTASRLSLTPEARVIAIGSRTKGITETKRFNGKIERETKEIRDTQYIRRKYYSLAFKAFNPNSLPIQGGSLKVWLDDRTLNRTQPVTMIVETLPDAVFIGTTTYTGQFLLLNAGQDYTVDLNTGLLVLRRTIQQNHVIAVDFNLPDGSSLSSQGTRGALKILKAENDPPKISRELKTFYTIGRTKLIRDDGRGNFLLKILDNNRKEVGAALDLVYPRDFEVDFEAGLFNFKSGQRFPEEPLYVGENPLSLRMFSIEYRYRGKTYPLRPNLVIGSERITMDNRVLVRDVDYFIDYESGFLTFFNEDRITDTTQIEVTYDYKPFAGQGGDTLVGTRTEVSLTPHVALGSSVLLNFSPKPTLVPDIRSTPDSILVYEIDSKLQNLTVGNLPLKSTFAGEVAQSRRDPNTFGKALIESMEGVKQEDQASLLKESWQRAAHPAQAFTGQLSRLDSLQFSNEEVRVNDVNPGASNKDDKLQVLRLDYNLTLTPGATAVSLVQPLSKVGRDFSKKLYVELAIFGDGSAGASDNTQLTVELGSFNENINSNGTLATEDINNNGTLDTGEDTGFPYLDPGRPGTDPVRDARTGAGNGRLDTQDFDGDGVLRKRDDIPSPGVYGTGNQPLVELLSTGGTATHSTVDWQGWKLFRIPLNISDPAQWTAVKQVRLTLQGQKSGTIRLGNLSVVGNKWEPPAVSSGSTLNIAAKNTQDDPDFRPFDDPAFKNEYKGLYDLSDRDLINRKEQALEFRYSLASNGEVSTREVFTRPLDLSKYQKLRFFVFGDPANTQRETVFIRAGGEGDFFEYSIPVSWTGWRVLTVVQVDPAKSGRASAWAADPIFGGTVRVSGSPSLTNIGQLRIGVKNGAGSTIDAGKLLIDEIHMTDSLTRAGTAKRVQGDFDWPRWATFGLKWKTIDRNFETLASAITNQDLDERSSYLKFSRFQVFPMTFDVNRSITVTPSVTDIRDPNLVSRLQEGRVLNIRGGATGTLIIPKYPRVGLIYNTSSSDNTTLQRQDASDIYRTTLDYANPVKFALLPTQVTLGYSRTNDFLEFSQALVQGRVAQGRGFEVARQSTLTDEVSGRLPFQPLKALTVTPTYTFKRSEQRLVFSSTASPQAVNGTVDLRFPKALSQNIGVESRMKIFNWFAPTLQYRIDATETNNLPQNERVLDSFNRKAIVRTNTTQASWDLAAKELLPRARPLSSLLINSSYRTEDGDSYENVDRSISMLKELWVRKAIRINPEGRRKSLTARDTIQSTQKWNPFDWTSWHGILLPFKTLSLTSNVTDSRERTEETGTPRRVFTRVLPDLIFSLTNTESLFHAERFMSDSQLNLKGQKKTVETVNISLVNEQTLSGDWRLRLFRQVSLALAADTKTGRDTNTVTGFVNRKTNNLGWSIQPGFTLRKWQFTPKYDQRSEQEEDGTGKALRDLLTRASSLQVTGDVTLPRFFRLPFGRRLTLSNRLISTTNISFKQQRSGLNVAKDNTNVYTFTTNGNMEVSPNIRLILGSGYTRNDFPQKTDENFYSFEFSSQLNIEF